MESKFLFFMGKNSDELRKMVCNLSSISERYFSCKINQDLAIDQIRFLISQPHIIESLNPFLSSSDIFLLTKSIFMEFRKLSNEDMNELIQNISIIFIRLLDKYEADVADVIQHRVSIQAGI